MIRAQWTPPALPPAPRYLNVSVEQALPTLFSTKKDTSETYTEHARQSSAKQQTTRSFASYSERIDSKELQQRRKDALEYCDNYFEEQKRHTGQGIQSSSLKRRFKQLMRMLR